MLDIAGDDRQPGSAPLRKAILQAARLEATSAKRGHGLVGQNAVRSAAIGDDLLGAIELGEARFKLAQRNVHRAGQMSERKFIRRADIEDADHACARFFQKLLA